MVTDRTTSYPPCPPAPGRFLLTLRTWVLVLLAVLPILFIASQVATWTRNIPNWDEFDTVLDLLVALDASPRLAEISDRLFAVQNEHRTFVSRLIFAGVYWVTDGINFTALAVLGNLFLAGVFWQLLARVEGSGARLRLAAIFSLAVFQLQHHESLFWAGSSIDHFFVILAVVASLAALTSTVRWAVPLATSLAFLATFSLAHGMLIWPIGALLLWIQQRRRGLVFWLVAGAGSIALFFSGFYFNPGHPLPGFSDWPEVLVYWLLLVGSSPALDNILVAPWLGGIIVAATILMVVWRWRTEDRLSLAVILWCLGALGLIAMGRALLASEWAPLTSRYVILSSIACALLIWLLVERALAWRPREGRWCLAGALAVLVAFNITASLAHEDAGRVFAQHGEKAVAAYHRYGTFARGETQLYPDCERADALVRAAQKRRILRLPGLQTLDLAHPTAVVLRNPEEIDDASYFIEEVREEGAELRIRGWAFRPDHATRPGDLSIVFRSSETAIAFDVTPQVRPDVAAVFERADVTYSGFQLRLARERLPAGVFGIGVCFDLDDSPEYMMTANTVVISKSSPVATR